MKGLRFAIPAAFLAAFPVLFLYRHNFSEVADLETIAIPLALSLAVAVLVFVGLSRWIPEPVRRAVYSSAIVIFLFYFGTFADLTQAARWAAPTWMSALAWTTLWFSVLMLLSRRRTSLAALYQGVFYCSSFLVGFELLYIGTAFMSSPETAVEAIELVEGRPQQRFPDIYHLVLDGYAGAPTLNEKFHNDNEEFLVSLKDKGFTVSGRSRSNYPATFPSLASMLNLDYVSALPIQVPKDEKKPQVFIELIRANRVSKFLREKGYDVIHFKTDWPGTSANVYATRVVDCFDRASGPGTLSSRFGLVWQQTTILRTLSKPLYRATVADPSADAFECMFTELAQSSKVDGPKYVFAHIMLPHPPYVFDEHGNRRDHSTSSARTWQPEAEYFAQLKYLNKRVSEVVDAILAEPGDPIIVLHSDHGPAFSGNGYSAEMLRERFRILMAIRLPQGMGGLVHDTMTPVNVFRLIFDKFLDGRFESLPEKCYFADVDTSLFNYREVTDQVTFD